MSEETKSNSQTGENKEIGAHAADPGIGSSKAAPSTGPQNGQASREKSKESEPATGLTGRSLAHFQLVEKLGGGGGAAVYRAVDARTGAPVAVKALLAGADDTMRERFRREGELVGALRYPHIVETLEVGETTVTGALNGQSETITYIAMQLIEGCSLAQLLEKQGRLSATDATALLAPIAQALDYAHSREIVHRDVKPSNILLRREEGNPPGSIRISALEYAVTPLLSDFGIARAMDAPELTNTGRTIGTPAFMSPEQCAGAEELDGRSDVYGLGAVLYRCIVGKTPYSGSTTQMLYAHVYEPLLIPDELVALLPPIALATLQRSMMKDPKHRYQDAGEMAGDLTLVSGRISPDALDSSTGSTVTMPALPSVRREGQTGTARVLVPVALPVSAANAPPFAPNSPDANRPTVKLEAAAPRMVERTEDRMIERTAERALQRRNFFRSLPRGRRLRKAWGTPVALAVAALFLVAVGISVFGLIFWPQGRDFLAALQASSGSDTPGMVLTTEPGDLEGNDAIASLASEGTPIPIQASGNDHESGDRNDADTSPGAGESMASPQDNNDPPATSEPGTPDPQGTAAPSDSPVDAPEVAETPELADPSEVELNEAWEDALRAYDALEWDAALEQLLLVRLLDRDYEAARVSEMLGTAYLESAQTAFSAEDLDVALENMLLAAQEQTNPELGARLEAALEGYETEPDSEPTVEELRAALADVADHIAGTQRPCLAVTYGTLAVALGETTESAWLDGLIQACEETRVPPAPAVMGRLIYSSQEGSAYRIFAMPIPESGSSSLLVENGSQPRLGIDGQTVAFYSRQPGAMGLMGINLFADQSPAAGGLQYTGESEDSRDSPPSWSPSGDRLAFSSARGDGRHRIYVTSADSNQQAQALHLGKDPAWHPSQDLLVFNGVDQDEQNPGLWLIRPDGTGGLRQLTDNGNDMRPVWTPDGRHIVFMSSGRDGRWEVYRINVETQEIARLTFSESQDGLPTVSPNGVYVAFASDRAGFWELWYVPLMGGNSARLGSMNGQLVSWLEHGLQWVP